jgi:C_GCAxxG_C_C family probable redox protein
MLKDKIKEYYGKTRDLNCAESILYAANDEYNLKLNKDALKTMAAFGGGMGVEGVCGAISGVLGVLGIMFVKDRAHESDKIKLLSQRFIKNFEARLNSQNCGELKKNYRNETTGCSSIVDTAVEILDDIIREESLIQ